MSDKYAHLRRYAAYAAEADDESQRHLGEDTLALLADLYTANARADEAEEMCEILARSACSCLGTSDCDTFFEDDGPEKDAKCAECRAHELNRAREAVRHE